ncbi:hypothetical protein [Algibacter luteus]|uniref:Uncharacterized protein n=1 Tax=Algibacter luteus TaxID=1178825 RepID=A0A1M6AQL6_9FLAO|nr:hypothetical protein [Algibacter luteus]SHI38762.1 hypothetical protein SAMN05216261_0564 [Algibacter luteus]
MKNSIKVLFIIAFLFGCITIGFAQKPEQAGKKEKVEKKIKKEKKELNEDVEEVVKEKKQKKQKKQKKEKVEKKIKKEKKEKSEKVEKEGNSFGKDKYGLEGKAYGQERARQAKLNKEEKTKEFEATLEKGKEKANKAREKVKEVKDNLKAQKSQGRITDKEYNDKLERIEAIEKETDSLEQKIEKGKKLRKS